MGQGVGNMSRDNIKKQTRKKALDDIWVVKNSVVDPSEEEIGLPKKLRQSRQVDLGK